MHVKSPDTWAPRGAPCSAPVPVSSYQLPRTLCACHSHSSLPLLLLLPLPLPH